MTVTLAQLAAHVDADLRGNPELEITGLATLASASPSQVAFLANEKYVPMLASTQAGAVILKQSDDDGSVANAILTNNPYLAYAKIAQLLDTTPVLAAEVHPSAVIDPSARLADGVAIGPNVVIEAGADISAGVQLHANVFVGRNVQIGANTKVWPQVTLYHEVVVGARCNIHANTVIGSDGFGWASENGKWVKIPQLGRVVIGDDVELGSGCTIDRGALDDTIIEAGCILDNQVHVAHNVIIGSGSAIAGQTGIAGSAKIGRGCMMGGQVAINGHIELADGVQVHGKGMITKSITEAGIYASGQPAMAQSEWAKTGVRYRQLPELFNRVKAIEKIKRIAIHNVGACFD